MEDDNRLYGGIKKYNGWYPKLFYRSQFQGFDYSEDQGSDKWDAIVTDIHTDPPCAECGSPGAILTGAVGSAHLLMIAIDSESDTMVYAGPVLSHYEFQSPYPERLTDEAWRKVIRDQNQPGFADWTKGYLVPGEYIVPPLDSPK